MPLCEIIFDNNSEGVFSSGETISGIINFDNDENLKISSISLTFLGRAKCKWYKQKGQRYRRKYTGKEEYANEIIYFMGDHEESNDFDLPRDLYHFTFSFETDENFPSSVSAKEKEIHCLGTYSLHGFVRYVLILKVVQSSYWKYDIIYEFPIIIVKKLDLNLLSYRIRIPALVEETKMFRFSSKHLHISVSTPFTGFVPGQKGKLTVKYINESNVVVAQTKVQLIRIIKCIADKPKSKSKIGYEKIEETTFDGVSAKTMMDIETFLTVPVIAPSTNDSCKVLDISYEVYITAVFKGIHRDFTIKVPIVIGTVPLETMPSITE